MAAGPQAAYPVHIFTYADQVHPSLCTLAASVDAIGGRLNILELSQGGGIGAVPPAALESVATTLVEHARQPKVPGRRNSCPVSCSTRDACFRSMELGLQKIRKFFGLRPHLKDFHDDEVLLYLDGFDAVVESPSLEHFRSTFERVQRGLGPLVAPAGGPVIFSGEMNCWPFPHSWGSLSKSYASGDYRPDYVYAFGNATRIRGDQMCEHWSRMARSGAQPEHQFHLPFLNSGVFAGRAGSLRHLFDLAADTLRLFGDFEDQALVYTTLLRATSARQPWVPLVVDSRGELFASLHGQDLGAAPARPQRPGFCNFSARVDSGFYAAASGSSPGRWDPRSRAQPPLVAHFNGDGKEFFGQHCHTSVLPEIYELGREDGICRFIDYPNRQEVVYRSRWGSEARTRAVPFPLPLAALTPAQVLGTIHSAQSARGIRDALLARAPAPQLLVEAGARPSIQSHCGAMGPAWYRRVAEERWAAGQRPPVGSRPDVVVVAANRTSCSRRRPRFYYCALFAALQAAWDCLLPSRRAASDSVPASAGFLWAEFRGPEELQAWSFIGDSGRHDRECRRDEAADGTAGGRLCPAWAVADFLASVSPWEASPFRFMVAPDDAAVILAVKESVWE